jgi:hypothetical protein
LRSGLIRILNGGGNVFRLSLDWSMGGCAGTQPQVGSRCQAEGIVRIPLKLTVDSDRNPPPIPFMNDRRFRS